MNKNSTTSRGKVLAWSLPALLAPVLACAELVFTSEPMREATVDRPYVYRMTAADDGRPRGGRDVRFSALELPAWLDFNGNDRLSGTPRDGDVGNHRVRLLARRRGDVAAQTFTIRVRPETPKPEPPPPPPPRASADLEVSLSVDPNPALVGAVHTWTAAVRNLGESDVANLELTIVLDAPASYRVEDVSDQACAPSRSDTITCRWSAIESGQAISAAIQGLAGDAGTVGAAASVAILDPTVADGNASNDRATAPLSITEIPTVSPVQTLPARGARDVAVADLDGDGRDDLAIAAADGVLVFSRSPDDHGRPFGAAPLTVDTAAGGAALAAADLDGDSRIDLVVARPAAASVVLFATDSGDVETVTLDGSAGAHAVAVGDFDGDSLPDVALGTDTATLVYRHVGGRQFAEPETVIGGPSTAIAAADLTGDGRTELVVGSDARDVEVYRRDTEGFALAVSPETGASSSLATADVDGDAVPDLAVGSRSAADRVLLTRGTGSSLSFAPTPALAESATVDILLADFDGDGGIDVATIGASGVHRVYAHDGSSPPAFALQAHRFTGARNPSGAAAGMFDFDEIPDVAVATEEGVEIFVNVGRPLPPGAPRLVLNGEPTIVLTVGDEYVDPGASAFDDVDGNLTSSIVVTNPVDAKTIGSYVVTYEVEDSSGNKTTATRTVEIQARTAVGGGGGGAAGFDALALLCVSLSALRVLGSMPGRARRARPALSERCARQSGDWLDRSSR